MDASRETKPFHAGDIIKLEGKEVVIPEDHFEPSLEMRKFLEVAIISESGNSPVEWCKYGHISYDLFIEWRRNSQFVEWFNLEFLAAMEFYRLELLKIGIHKMSKSPAHWLAMAKLFYPDGITPPKSVGSTREKLEAEITTIIRKKRKISEDAG